MNDNINTLQSNLRDLSFYLGSNLDWVQGAGGNTSVKYNDTMLVKASGFWLSDAQNKNIFSCLNLNKLYDLIDKEYEDLSQAQMLQNNNKENFRPSIETSLHALMPHKFVIHVHSTNVIASAVLKNCGKFFKENLGDVKWLLIPYVRPGLPLTKKLKKLNAFNFDILILANHGLVIGGETKSKVIETLLYVEKKLSKSTRFNFSKPDKKKLNHLIRSSNYKLPKYDLCHSLAMDEISLNLLIKKPLYPDHIIFLGPGGVPVMTETQFVNKLTQSSNQLSNKVIVIKGIGIIIRKDLSENGEEMLHCLTNVLLKIQDTRDLNHLTEKDEMELLGWDAEKYRKTIER